MEAHFFVGREENVDVFSQRYENDYCFPQFHSPIELYFITDGAMEITVNGKTRLLQKNELAVSFPFDTHTYKTPNFSRSKCFIIPLMLLKEFESLLLQKKASCNFITDADTVQKINELTERYLSGNGSVFAKKGILYLILDLICKNAEFSESREDFSAPLSRKILLFMEEKFTENITLGDLSKHLGYSYTYLSHYFSDCFGVSFHSYLNNLRLNRFVSFLQEGEKNITECAFKSGFPSLRSFYRIFSDRFGTTPKNFLNHRGWKNIE